MKYLSQQSGFSLVETLVAISILLIVMVGPMTISSSAARSTSFSSEQVTAFFLAQEGAELAQKARDDLQIQAFAGALNNPWARFTNTNGTYAFCYRPEGCDLTVNTNSTATLNVTRCNEATSCVLQLNTQASPLRSRYQHGSGVATLPAFTRKIFLSNVSANEVRVVSQVTWQNGSFLQEQKVEVETRLFNVYGTQ